VSARTNFDQMPELQTAEYETAGALRGVPVMANPLRVRRTQRVVRERAVQMRVGRARMRVIAAACILVSALLAVVAIPLWNTLDEFAHWSDIPDLQIHMLFLAVWFLPGTIAALLLWRGQRKRIDQLTQIAHTAQR
jgi:hypothetical protein